MLLSLLAHLVFVICSQLIGAERLQQAAIPRRKVVLFSLHSQGMGHLCQLLSLGSDERRKFRWLVERVHRDIEFEVQDFEILPNPVGAT